MSDPNNPLGNLFKGVNPFLTSDTLANIQRTVSELNRPIVPPSVSMPTSSINPARWTYDRLADYIENFEKDLDQEHEIGARLVSFGSSITFHINDIGYWGPDIITFDGVTANGEVVKLIQNTSQLSVLLMAMKKREAKARRIGFKLKEHVGEED